MSRRAQVQGLIGELVFVEAARKRAKMQMPEAVKRISDALDWEAVDAAGNNLDTTLHLIRQAAARAVK